jgi:hypothetical protein
MKILTAIGIGLIILIALVGMVFAIVGAERFWRFFGEPDLGPVQFEQLQRRTSANDALACPDGMCSTPAEIATPRYPVTARDLRAAFAQVLSTFSAANVSAILIQLSSSSLTVQSGNRRWRSIRGPSSAKVTSASTRPVSNAGWQS